MLDKQYRQLISELHQQAAEEKRANLRTEPRAPEPARRQPRWTLAPVNRALVRLGKVLSDRRWLGLACAGILLAMAGVWLYSYSSQIRAPALHNGPVYQNNQEGFRFLVSTDDWVQTASAAVPRGQAADERMVVEYKLLTSDAPAELRVTAIDMNKSAVDQYLVTHSPDRKLWTLAGETESLNIGGVPAERVTLHGDAAAKGELTHEVVAFHRGERYYFFIGDFATADKKAQQHIRRVVDSVIWK
ncbi:MAG TPA: hypothetical protein VGY58_13860 [Gemmataceae bacterium]|jgi:hypothetical protein|nr:hypothetical protein [Gemmataceae bacterium]